MRLMSAVLAVLAIAVSAAVAGTPEILARYDALRASGAAPDLSYEIRPDGAGWVAASPATGQPVAVTVDDANGFAEIADEGTGGGLFETRLALWRMADGTVLLGVGETTHSIPPWPDDTRLRFFALEAGRWEDRTSHVWPGVALTDFMTDAMTIADLRALRAVGPGIYLPLPITGDAPEAWLETRDDEIEAVCSGADWIEVPEPALYRQYCERLRGALFRTILFDWDPATGRFAMGARY